jgi:hypothetical protein
MRNNFEKMKDKVNKKEKTTKEEIEKLKEIINELLLIIQTRNF